MDITSKSHPLTPLELQCSFILKVKSKQCPGTDAIRTQILSSKPKREITKITNSLHTTIQ